MSAVFGRLSRVLRFSHSLTPALSTPPHLLAPPTLAVSHSPFFVSLCHSSNSTGPRTPSDHTHTADEVAVPDPPTDCCMNGCANCVWITYAAELASIYKDGGKASERVMRAIDDPSLKIFLNLELKELLKDFDTDSVDAESDS